MPFQQNTLHLKVEGKRYLQRMYLKRVEMQVHWED